MGSSIPYGQQGVPETAHKNRGMERERQLVFLARTKRAGFVTSSRAALSRAVRGGDQSLECPRAIPGVIGLGLDPERSYC